MAISVFVYIKILVVIHARIIQVNGGGEYIYFLAMNLTRFRHLH